MRDKGTTTKVRYEVASIFCGVSDFQIFNDVDLLREVKSRHSL
jgi:hypothetical protein